MRVDVSVEIAAPREVVWEVLTDWERQPRWMVDAQAVHVLTPHREGEGVTVRCPTNLLGVTVQDVMRVTVWDPPRRFGVVHLGRVIRGTGEFTLVERGPGRTRLTWTEEVDPPLGPIGELGARLVVAPITRWLFRRSLGNLAELSRERADRARSVPR